MTTIGLTFFLREKESVWNSGAAQNCFFLYRLLRAADFHVLAINAGHNVRPDPALMAAAQLEYVPVTDAVLDQVDVLIEAAGQVSAEAVARVHAHGGKAVAFRFGNSYAVETERAIHGKAAGAIINGARFDAVWTNPQHMRTCASYWETLYRAPVRCLPHVWLPTFVDGAVAELGTAWGYHGGRRVGIFEPNINLVKTAMIPLLACERLYRRNPGAIDQVLVTNALHLKEHLTFRKAAGSLDIVRDGVASFEGRFNTPWMLARHCDVMLAHQWENGLNYAYYDALHGSFPVVHNSDLLPVGYRYEGFDAEGASLALEAALLHHDALDYQARAGAYLLSVNALNPINVSAHARAIAELRN
jgi:hypothetical protein